MDEFTKFLIVLAPLAFVGLVVWTWNLWLSHGKLKQELANLRVHLVENHPTKHDMEERKQWELRMEQRLDDVRLLLGEIKTRLEMRGLKTDATE